MSVRLDSLADELLALKNADGVINPTDVVRWARRNRRSHLHAHLTWDDEVAGERYRVWQIRELIGIHILDAEGSRRLVSLSIDRAAGGYRPVADVIERPDLRDIMLSDALAELERVQRRYAQLTELQRVWEAAEGVKAGRKQRAPRKRAA